MPNTKVGNLFADLPTTTDSETITSLVKRPGVRIERIVSTGQASPPGFWYDQSFDEWVLLVAGAARMEIEGEGERSLAAGDYLVLPAHCRHRIVWTDPAKPTVWLAIHLDPAAG